MEPRWHVGAQTLLSTRVPAMLTWWSTGHVLGEYAVGIWARIHRHNEIVQALTHEFQERRTRVFEENIFRVPSEIGELLLKQALVAISGSAFK